MNQNIRGFWILVFIAIAVFLSWYFLNLLIYILVAAVLSYILNPLVNLLTKIKIKSFSLPRGIAVVFSLLIFLGCIALFFSMFMPILIKEIKLIKTINPEQVANTFETQIYYVEDFFISNHYLIQPHGFIMNPIKENIKSILNTSHVPLLFNSVVSTTGNFLFTVFAIIFITFFMIREEYLFKKTVIDFFPDRYNKEISNAFERIEYLLSRFFIGVLIQSFNVVCLVSLGMFLFGIKNAFVIGFFAGIINVVPYIGPLVAAAFGIVVGLTSNLDLISTGTVHIWISKIAIVFVVVQLLDALIFQPFIFSKSVFAHPLEIFLIVLIGAKLGGPLGMFLAIPMYTIIRVTAKEFFNSYKIVQKFTKNV